MIPFIERQLATTKRVDVILDCYLADCISGTTRQRREQESDSGCDMMGVGRFPDIGPAISGTFTKKNLELFHYLSVSISQTVCQGEKYCNINVNSG